MEPKAEEVFNKANYDDHVAAAGTPKLPLKSEKEKIASGQEDQEGLQDPKPKYMVRD
jgi:hypothetical protein